MFTDEQIALLLALAGVVMNKSKDEVIAAVKKEDAKASEFKELAITYGKTKLKEGEGKGIGLIKDEVKKTLKIKVDNDLNNVEDIVKQIGEKITEQAEAEPDEAKVKASPAYKTLNTELETERGKVTTLTDGHKKELLNVKAGINLANMVSELKAIIPENADDAKLKSEMIYESIFNKYNVDPTTDGDYYLQDKVTGANVNNANGHRMTLKELGTRLITTVYGVQTVQQRENHNPNNPNPLNPKGPQGNFKKYKPEEHGAFPKTEAEVLAFKQNYNIPPDVRIEVGNAWAAQQQAPTT